MVLKDGDDVFQHQQQVAAAVERAKQITVQELNAIIGVWLCELVLAIESPPEPNSYVFIIEITAATRSVCTLYDGKCRVAQNVSPVE